MEAPKLPTVFKQIKARSFGYQPIYYDEEKERREELKRKYAGEQLDADVKKDFRDHFRSEINKNRGKQVTSSNSRLLIIITILILLTYLLITF